MSYYSYHNRLKELLREERYVVVEEKGNPFVYRFIFPRIMKSMPIREYRVEEYREYIERGGNI